MNNHTAHKIIAAIDIGTNSIHLVIAKIDEKKRFVILTKDKEVVRLGSGSKDMKCISGDAMDRAIKVLKRYKQICDSYNAKIISIGTSATREAANKHEFITRAYEEAGVKIEIVSGYEEARLIYLGALQALPVYDRKILLIDIGGGSTEFLIGRKGEVIFASSLKLGAVRLTHRFFDSKNYDNSSINDARTFIRAAINPIIKIIKNKDPEIVVGTSGTIENIASMINAGKQASKYEEEVSLNKFIFDKSDLKKISERVLKAESFSERTKIEGLDPKRADIIVAGILILEEVFNALNLQKLTVSNYALREGIILNAIAVETGDHSLGHLEDTRLNSVLHIGEITGFEKEHAFHTMKLANKIFDSVKKKLKLSENDRILLQSASLLHDVGYFISHSSHHKHSYYIIRNAEILGFNDKEIEIIANVARYHRKSHPKQKHEAYSRLDSESREKVKKLAGILRIADSLDRAHASVVKDIEINLDGKEFEIKLISGAEDLSLEKWAVNLRKELFEEASGYRLSLRI